MSSREQEIRSKINKDLETIQRLLNGGRYSQKKMVKGIKAKYLKDLIAQLDNLEEELDNDPELATW